ncbi:MAG: Na+/H+ antiporter subunit E [Leucobacter sp.]
MNQARNHPGERIDEVARDQSVGPRAVLRLERGVRLYEVPLLVGLVVTWMALWREVSLMSVASGVLVAVMATRVFYLPPVKLAGRMNVWWALRYVAYFLWHVALASWHVAWLAVKPGPTPTTSIIAVKLRTQSDFIIAMVGMTNSLIPGSLVVDVDRFRSTLYIHVLNTPTEESLDNMRHNVYHIESLLIRAVGSIEEVEALN